MHETLQVMNINEGNINYSIRTRLIGNSGAGVNADSRINLAFAASDPLSELVWSPHNGLSLKCTNSGAADKKPVLLWNVEPSNTGPSPSWIIGPEGSQGENAVDDIFVEGTERNMETEEAGSKDAIQKEDNCTGDDVAEFCKENADLQPQKELDDKVTSANGKANGNKTNMPISIPASSLKKVEPAAEKDAPVKGFEINSRTCLYNDMWKEKALSDGDIYMRSLDDAEGSHESVESCNSAGLFPKGIKRQSYDDGVILGSKKMKKQFHGNPESTFITRPNSSFLSWISNMVKGFSDYDKADSSSIPLPFACSIDVNGENRHESFMCSKAQDSAIMKTGFQTMFQSLSCRHTNIFQVQKENASVGGTTSLKNLPGSTNCDSSCKQIISSDGEINPITADQPIKPFILSIAPESVENVASESPVSDPAKDGVIPSDSSGEKMNYPSEKSFTGIPVATSDEPGKRNLLDSLWVTRLCTKNPRSGKCQEIIQETIECSTSCPKINFDSQINSVLPIDQKSSETRDDSFDSQVYAAMKESRIFATDTEISVNQKSKNMLFPLLPSQKISSEAMASVFARRLDALRHIMPLENDVKEDPKSPLCDIIAARNTVALSEIFHAIRNLRLSRADILKWMNSNSSLSYLNGFFLRLRLGKLGAGLEGTRYHVARITGDAGEINGCSSKKSILVDVGGIKSSVSSQYVSNHDFLEDEIKAWWGRILENGCAVPSLDELNSKFNDRKSLSF